MSDNFRNVAAFIGFFLEWFLVEEDKECTGHGEYKGRFQDLVDCANACNGVSTMFIFGIENRTQSRCNNDGCKCFCETSAAANGTCNMTPHNGYRIYGYQNSLGSCLSRYIL